MSKFGFEKKIKGGWCKGLHTGICGTMKSAATSCQSSVTDNPEPTGCKICGYDDGFQWCDRVCFICCYDDPATSCQPSVTCKPEPTDCKICGYDDGFTRVDDTCISCYYNELYTQQCLFT